MRWLGVALTIPFILALSPLVGWWVGSLLDQFLQTDPYFMYLFILLGMIAGFKEVYRIIKRYGNDA